MKKSKIFLAGLSFLLIVCRIQGMEYSPEELEFFNTCKKGEDLIEDSSRKKLSKIELGESRKKRKEKKRKSKREKEKKIEYQDQKEDVIIFIESTVKPALEFVFPTSTLKNVNFSFIGAVEKFLKENLQPKVGDISDTLLGRQIFRLQPGIKWKSVDEYIKKGFIPELEFVFPIYIDDSYVRKFKKKGNIHRFIDKQIRHFYDKKMKVDPNVKPVKDWTKVQKESLDRKKETGHY